MSESDYKRRYRRTPQGMIRETMTRLRRSARTRGLEFTLSEEWIRQKLSQGRCEQTGIAFAMNDDETRHRSPWTFSIDRMDPSKGYIPENCQAVVWMYNAAKSEGSDADVIRMAKALLGLTVEPTVPRDDRFSTPAVRYGRTGIAGMRRK